MKDSYYLIDKSTLWAVGIAIFVLFIMVIGVSLNASKEGLIKGYEIGASEDCMVYYKTHDGASQFVDPTTNTTSTKLLEDRITRIK